MFSSEENWKIFVCAGLPHSHYRESSQVSNSISGYTGFGVSVFTYHFWRGRSALIEQPWLSFNYECPNLIPFIKIFQSTFRDDLHEFCFYKFPECEIAYMICILLSFFNILCHHVIQLMFLINVYIIFSFYLFKLGHVLPMIIKGYLKKIGGNSSSIIYSLSIFRFWH